MKIAGVREVKQKLSQYIKAAHQAPVILTKNGRPCAALVELTNEMDLEAFLTAYNHRITTLINRSAASKVEIPFEEVEKMVDSRLRKTKRQRK